MRAGYDRVYSDSRQRIIPDLPVPEKYDLKIQDHEGRAGTVVGALFAIVLTIAGGVALMLGSG